MKRNNRHKTVAIVISDVDRAIAFEWIADALKQDFRLVFILIGERKSALHQFLKERSVEVYNFPSLNRFGRLITLLQVFWRLLLIRPEVVHTHLIKANVAGLTAAWLLRVPKRIYTRHHALIHHREYPKGLWQDKWCNYTATDVVAISKITRHVLTDMEGVPPEKVSLIRHGFDLKYFLEIGEVDVEKFRTKHGIPPSKPIVGVVARYQAFKGIQYIIPAFEKLLVLFPKAHLVLANAVGHYRYEIKKMLDQLPMDSYTEILFEHNIPTLFKSFDVYVHTPIDEMSEAFGQTYIEALACGIPSVFTLSGVASEFIIHEQNALVVPFCNSESIYQSMSRILNDTELKEHLIENGKKSVTEFSLDNMINQLRQLYGS